MRAAVLFFLPSCSLPQCEALCARDAECIQSEIDAYGSSWEDFTGLPDRAQYEEQCMAVFEESHRAGSSRKELQKTCREDLESNPCATP